MILSSVAVDYPENRVAGSTYTTLGCAQLFSGDIESAVKNLREAMGNLANCEAKEGNFAAAIELLRTAMKIDSENNQLKENLRTFQEAQRLNPSP